MFQIAFKRNLNDFTRVIALTNQLRSFYAINNHCQNDLTNNRPRQLLKSQYNHVEKRFKKPSKVEKILQEVEELKDELSDDSDNEDEDNLPGLKTFEYKVNSLRIDTVMKTATGISRSKLEKAFYRGKMYLNGEQILKKGRDVKLHDVIDFIKGPHPQKSNVSLVTRVTLINWKLQNMGYKITVTRENVETDEYKVED